MFTAWPVSCGACNALLPFHTPVLNYTSSAGNFYLRDLVIWGPLAFWLLICKKTGFPMLDYVHILFWTGACLGSRDTSAKVRCSAPARCVCVGCAVLGELPHAAGSSCSYKLLWSHHSSSSPAKNVHLSSCQADALHACSSNHLLSYIHAKPQGSRCCFILCRSTELWSACSTQLSLRHPWPVFSWYWDTTYPTGMATLFLSLPVKFKKNKIRNVTSKGSLVGWHSTLVWMHALAEWLYRCMWCLIIVLPFPFSVVRWQNYLLHRCLVIQHSLLM